jgi:HD-like signal output (HDOD) protein
MDTPPIAGSARRPEPVDLQALSGRIQDIFPMPLILEKILQVVNRPESSMADIESVFKYEPSLTLKILTLANSAYFGVPEKVTNIRAAITLLGLNLIKSLAIHASVNELFRFGTTLPSFSGYELWKHSVGVAVAAKMVARRLRLGQGEDFFTLGILHDVGLIIEYQFFREQFVSILSRLHVPGMRLAECEREVLGTDHAAVARMLGEKWSLPPAFCRILEFHHHPLEAPADLRRSAAAVYLADNLVRRKAFGFGCLPEVPDPEVFAVLGCTEADLAPLSGDFDQEIVELTIFLQ